MLDLMMLVGPGGRERTKPGYGTLLGKAALGLDYPASRSPSSAL